MTRFLTLGGMLVFASALAAQQPGRAADDAWMDAYGERNVAWVEGVVTAIDAVDRQFTVHGRKLEETRGVAAGFNRKFTNDAYLRMNLAQLKEMDSHTFFVNRDSRFFGLQDRKPGAAEGVVAGRLSQLQIGDVVRVGFEDGWFSDTVVSIQVQGNNEAIGAQMKKGAGAAE